MLTTAYLSSTVNFSQPVSFASFLILTQGNPQTPKNLSTRAKLAVSEEMPLVVEEEHEQVANL